MIFDDNIAEKNSALIKKQLREMPLEIRFKVWLEMEYLNLKIKPDTCCNEEEMKEAHEWAQKMTNYLLDAVEGWINDDAPMRKE